MSSQRASAPHESSRQASNPLGQLILDDPGPVEPPRQTADLASPGHCHQRPVGASLLVHVSDEEPDGVRPDVNCSYAHM